LNCLPVSFHQHATSLSLLLFEVLSGYKDNFWKDRPDSRRQMVGLLRA
jgi:hypothetical protein